MTFITGIPADGQSLGSSRTQVRGNFTNYNDVVSQDHVAPNASGQGKHKKSTYTVQSQSPATNTTEIAAYSRTINGIVEWCLQRSNQIAGADDIQLTSGTPGQGNSVSFGQSFLAGGFEIKWGIETLSSGAITYGARGLDNFTNNTILAVVVANGTDTNQSAQPSSYSNTGFTITTSKTNLSVSWVAIGY